MGAYLDWLSVKQQNPHEAVKGALVTQAKARLCAVFVLSSRKTFYGQSHDTVKRFTGKSFYDKMQEDERKRSPLVPLRERAGLTQEALANQLGVTDHTVRNWEKGRHEPKLTIRQVKRLCAALKCTLEDLPDDFCANKSAEA